jgi:hypothetical protein
MTYRQECDAEEYKNNYFIEDEEHIMIPKEDIGKVKLYRNNQDKIIYMYTFTDDVNAVLDDINRHICDEIINTENTLQRMKDLQSKFLKEKDRIAKKYPSEKKEARNE